jgi:DNA-binding NtrC family response regulator
MGRILLVGGDAGLRKTLASSLCRYQHEVCEFSVPEMALSALAKAKYDIIIFIDHFADCEMPVGGALAVLEAARDADPTLSAIILTHGIEGAIECVRQGASDFLARPFHPEVVCAAAQRACDRTRLLRENELLRKRIMSLEENGPASAHREGGNPGQPVQRSVPESFDLNTLLEQTEKDLIVQMLSATEGVQAEAARRMGLSRSALAYKLSKYRIRASQQQGA